MEKNKLYGKIFFFGGVGILFIVFYLISDRNYKTFRDKILESPSIVFGEVIEYSSDGAKHGSSIKYRFSYNNKTFNSKSSGTSFFSNRYSSLQSFIDGKKFPVIFNKKDPEMNQMLIIPDDFEFYNMPFPDSLQWVKEKLDE
jgi:hypothetical protein